MKRLALALATFSVVLLPTTAAHAAKDACADNSGGGTIQRDTTYSDLDPLKLMPQDADTYTVNVSLPHVVSNVNPWAGCTGNTSYTYTVSITPDAAGWSALPEVISPTPKPKTDCAVSQQAVSCSWTSGSTSYSLGVRISPTNPNEPNVSVTLSGATLNSRGRTLDSGSTTVASDSGGGGYWS